ncbi:hypothetical protein APR41_18310 [Salegentibacter salinarum]|uniref:DUF4886 domain-containing protein n=2 Tax=Salegentibacter salinarum TaxID=447422 RepID=A0A2N0TT53_9FLAO|nr:hypothetical protein APR41_18310 [Salegentibacter salinarum]
MPQMLQKMLNETNSNIKIDQITFPGISLSKHLDNIIEESSEDHIRTRLKQEGDTTATEKKIQEKKWDIIIKQTGTVAVLIPESRKYKTDPAIKQIKKLNDNDNSRYILFNTWTGKVEYPEQYCYSGFMLGDSFNRDERYCSPELVNELQYLTLINENYAALAKENSLELSKHGDIFYKVSENNPKIKILEDDIHPSKLGAFLSACIFYAMITNEDASNLEYNADLDTQLANVLKASVE